MQTHLETAGKPVKARSPRPTLAERRRQADEVRAVRANLSRDENVRSLATDIENIAGAVGNVRDEDLHLLGWSPEQLADMAKDAIRLVSGNAFRQLNPVN